MKRAGPRPAPSVWSKCSDLPFGQEKPGIENRIRVQRHAFDALIHQPARQVRVVGRALTADADVLAGLAARLDGAGQQLLDRRIALVEQVVDDAGVAVQDRKSTRLNSSHVKNSYAVFCLQKNIP